MFERILVCLDGSSLAEQILPYATEAAQRFNSKLILLQVIPPSSVSVGVETASEIIGPAKAYLKHVAQSLREKGLEVECVTLFDTPGKAIITYADKTEVGLITIATHGRSQSRACLVRKCGRFRIERIKGANYDNKATACQSVVHWSCVQAEKLQLRYNNHAWLNNGMR